MDRKVALAIVVGLFCIAGVLAFVTPRHCCGTDDAAQQEFEEVLGRAIGKDIQAIEKLYADYARFGHTEQARYWALIGAIEGSVKMTEIYEGLRSNTPSLDTTGEDVIIRKNLSKSGATRLAQTFTISETRSR
jgi:hypothetical protein